MMNEKEWWREEVNGRELGQSEEGEGLFFARDVGRP